MTKNEMIAQMWDIIGDLPISRRESMGDELYEAVGEHLGWFNDPDEDDDDMLDLGIDGE